MKTKLTYNEASNLIKEFSDKAIKAESIYFTLGFLQSFTAQLLSGRSVELSIRVLDESINGFEKVDYADQVERLQQRLGEIDMMEEICGGLKP